MTRASGGRSMGRYKEIAITFIGLQKYRNLWRANAIHSPRRVVVLQFGGYIQKQT